MSTRLFCHFKNCDVGRPDSEVMTKFREFLRERGFTQDPYKTIIRPYTLILDLNYKYDEEVKCVVCEVKFFNINNSSNYTYYQTFVFPPFLDECFSVRHFNINKKGALLSIILNAYGEKVADIFKRYIENQIDRETAENEIFMSKLSQF